MRSPPHRLRVDSLVRGPRVRRWVFSRGPARGLLAAGLLLGAVLLPGGCLVDGECYGDVDCEGGRICLGGQCVWECTGDDDCPGCRRCVDRRCTQCCRDSDCSADQYCEDETCLPAPGCLTCGELPHGVGECLHGICIVAGCEEGWHDANADAADGCEYACTPAPDAVETCNATDDDCDGRIDEDFNLARDPAHCGECNHQCPTPEHASPVCAGGQCVFECEAGWYDNDGQAENGCEADTCSPTAGGQEICDLRDNDCDGQADEEIDKQSTQSCGPLCAQCDFAHAAAACVGGACVMGACDEHWHNWDGRVENGCEAHCEPTEPPDEICDEVDNDCDGQVDENLRCDCPAGMVLVQSAFCIDRYEASRPDATAQSLGQDTSHATSRPGVMPWRGVSLQQAADACAAAGKRLCTPAEWEQACRGPDQTTYCYGDTYEEQTCNGIDAFWPNFHITPTGEFPECTNEYGVLDINGNIWERVQGGAGRGGAYNCSDSEALHRCDYVASWGSDPIANFGFRCCQ